MLLLELLVGMHTHDRFTGRRVNRRRHARYTQSDMQVCIATNNHAHAPTR
jgi:hypothetical protein